MYKKYLLSTLLTGFVLASFQMMTVHANPKTVDSTIEVNEPTTQEVEATYNQNSIYSVTIPKQIILDSNKESVYSVKVEGDISSDRKVKVEPQETTFLMRDVSANPKPDVEASIVHTKSNWNFEDAQNGFTSNDNQITATGLSAGTWRGTVNFDIDVERETVPFTITRNNMHMIGCDNYTTELEIPETFEYNGTLYKTVAIADGGLYTGYSLRKVTIPGSVKTIGKDAFYTNLEEIVLNEGLESIGNNAFIGTKLTEIAIPSTIKYIGRYAFQGSNITSVTIDGDIENIDDSAFNGAQKLQNVTINGNVGRIGSSAFYCMQANNGAVKIHGSVDTIEGTAFWCGLIKTFIVDGDVNSIGEKAFYSLNANEEFKIKGNVQSIGKNAFGSAKLNSAHNNHLELNGQNITFGEQAFYCSSSLNSIKINGSIDTINEEAFSNCSSLTSFIATEGIRTVGRGAFQYNSKLTTIDLSKTQRIEFNAFNNTSVNTVELSKQLAYLGTQAFGYSLQTLYYEGTEEEWNTLVTKGENVIPSSCNIVFNATR